MWAICILFLAVGLLGAYGDTTTPFEWVPASGGASPDGALGHDDHSSYVCRANTPTGAGGSGYLSPSLGGCIFVIMKTCHINRTYDVLIAPSVARIRWVPFETTGEIPLDAMSDGYGNLVGRSKHSGRFYFGSVLRGIQLNLFCPREGELNWESRFDLLEYMPERARPTSYTITDVTYNLQGINVTNASDVMIVANNEVHLSDRIDVFTADPTLMMPYDHVIHRQWNVTSIEPLPKGIPVVVHAGVLGQALSGDFSMTAAYDHHLQSDGMKEVHQTTITNQVAILLGDRVTTGFHLDAARVTVNAQAKLVKIPFKAILRYNYDGESEPIFGPIEGTYIDLQNYDVKTIIAPPSQ